MIYFFFILLHENHWIHRDYLETLVNVGNSRRMLHVWLICHIVHRYARITKQDELFLYITPIVNLQTKCQYGWQALIHWHDVELWYTETFWRVPLESKLDPMEWIQLIYVLVYALNFYEPMIDIFSVFYLSSNKKKEKNAYFGRIDFTLNYIQYWYVTMCQIFISKCCRNHGVFRL